MGTEHRYRRVGLVIAAALVLPGLTMAETEGDLNLSEPEPQQPETPLSVESCALIENGAKRLACFDSAIGSDERAANATPEQRQRIEQATTLLAPKTGGNVGVTEEDGMAEALVSRHLASEDAFLSLSGNFLPHKQTYLMPYSYVSTPNQRPYSPSLGFTDYDYDVHDHEAKFQISFKVPLLSGIFDKRSTLWFGYTQLSFWQVYNTDDSAPFRETNYEPELFFRYDARLDLGPGRLDIVTLGLSHQSNGQTEPQSRSWNRLTANLVYGVDRWLFIANPWYRLPESSRDDNNPDIDRYVGYGDYWAIFKFDEARSMSLRLRNNFRTSDNKTSVELGYSFPLSKTTKGYIQYFNGYGESLVDYNERIHRIGVGIMIHDWL
ncbi:phospholipase A [Marinobacter zhejiangensis]|uniref:phospholipase A n=1 Tax=Marinobacter zhejiangensis TaxID=488535 RepID=UPI001FDECC39|nr:phospholipase A [Marinobacter zhejiangensis]